MNDRKTRLILGAVLLLCVLAAFGNALGCGFVFDDLGAIVRNPSLHSLRTALLPPAGGFTTTGRPLLNLTFAANYAIGGLNPVGYHAGNVLIHGLAAIALLSLVYRTTRHMPLAFTAALLWALHPLQTESVTYVSQRAESLMGLFYLLTLLSLADHPARAVLCCLAGMATKEDMASAPVIAFLYDRTFLSGSFAAAWRARKGTYLALAGTWILLACEIYAAKGRGGTIGFNLGIPYGNYLIVQASAIVHYLRLALWPHPLIFDYGLTGPIPPAALALGAFVLVVVVFGVSVWLVEATAPSLPLPAAASRRHSLKASDEAVASTRRTIGFLGVWFFAMLAPTSLVPGNRQTWAEHRMYLALAPLAILLAGCLERRRRAWALPAALVLGAIYGTADFVRNRAYRTDRTIWEDTVAKIPLNPFAHYNLGVDELQQKDPQAESEFRAALALDPNYAEAHNNLGNALVARGELKEALDQYLAAAKLKPKVADFHNNLGNVAAAGGAYVEATLEYREALTLDPTLAEARHGLAGAYTRMGVKRLEDHAYGDGADLLAKAAALQPESAAARINFARALSLAGRYAAALPEYEAAIRLKPEDAGFRTSYGSALLALKRSADARAQYLEALRIDPRNSQAKLRLDLLEAR